jgi:hypothetical protein
LTALTGFVPLHRLLQRPVAPSTPAPTLERCELCGEPVRPAHRHLLDLSARELRCACRACVLLFDRPGAGGGHYRLIPDRRWHLHDFVLDDPEWESLRIPVHLAFFFHDSAVGRVVAFYPSPGGAVESLLEFAAWTGIEARNPILGEMQHDVEALLVNRARGTTSHWLVPVDDCYRLAGLIRAGWKGLGGGKEVWDDITRFFDDLRGQARTVGRSGAGLQAAANSHSRTWPQMAGVVAPSGCRVEADVGPVNGAGGSGKSAAEPRSTRDL